MHRQLFLLSILSISFILLLFFNAVDTSSKTSASVEIDEQQHIDKSSVAKTYRQPIIFSKYELLNRTRKPSENVICFLVASFTGEPRLAFNPYPRLREKVLQLDERFDDNYTTDVIIFHTGYPFRADLLPIIEGSRRQIEFVNVDHIFYKFSPGFDPHIRDPSWSQKGKWNYQHMCYFWFKQVFKLKIMQRYRYMLRLDDDSQLQGKWPDVFDIMVKHEALYIANRRQADSEKDFPGLTLVRNLTAAYIIKNNITIRNPSMLAHVFMQATELPNYLNNIEVIDLSFIRRKEVIDFMQAIDESKGIFLYRWGDAPLRYITLAVFAKSTQILDREKLELGYCHPC